MRRRARSWLFVLLLAVAVTAWGELSVLSPVRGGINHTVTRCRIAVLKRYQRATANVPCTNCPKTRTDINEIHIAYPSYFTKSVPLFGDRNSVLGLTDDREMVGLTIDVVRFARKTSWVWGAKWENVGDARCDSQEIEGWRVRVCRNKESGGVRLVRILGNSALVDVTALIPSHLRDTELAKWVESSVQQMMSDICASNAAALDYHESAVRGSPSNFGVQPTALRAVADAGR